MTERPSFALRPLPRTAALVSAALVASLAFVASLLEVYDTDTFHHLAMGRHIARHGLAPGEPFLFPFHGVALGPVPYWLGSLAIYGWHVVTGDAGLPYLPAAMGALLALVLLADMAPRGTAHTPLSLAASALPLVLAVTGFRYRAVARPEVFATLFVALTLWAVRRFEDGRPRMLYAFPGLALLWTNVHASVVVGVALVLLHSLCGAITIAWARLRRVPLTGAPARQAVTSAAIGMAGLLLGLLNPSPDNPVPLALRFGASAAGVTGRVPGSSAVPAADVVLGAVREMRPPELRFFVEPFGILVVLTVIVLAAGWRLARLREIAVVAAFGAMTAGAARFAVLLGVACAPIAARGIASLLAAAPAEAGRVRVRALVGSGLVLAAIASAVPLARAERSLCFGTGLKPGAYPTRPAEYLSRVKFTGRLFNTFQFGGYLSWLELGPPYQDGRGLLHQDEAAAAMVGPIDRERFERLDRKYRFDALLVAYPDEQPRTSERLLARYGTNDWTADRRTWSLVAFDDGGLLYLRRDGALADRATEDEYRTAMPANVVLNPRPDELLPLLIDYRRSVRESPACVLCRYYHAVAALSVGNVEEAHATIAGVQDAECAAHVLPIEAVRQEIARASGNH